MEATEHCADEHRSFGPDTKQGSSETIAASEEVGPGGLKRIAWIRSVGIYFDCICLAALWFFPGLIHNVRAGNFSSVRHASDLIASLADTNWLLLLVCTPVPLITLRFFCKVVMGMPTPGEFLCGYASVSDGSLVVRSLQNVGIALCQYVVVCVSLLGAPLCAILAAFPPLWLLTLPHNWPQYLASFAEVRWVFILGCPVLTAYLIVYFPSLFLRPKSAVHFESLIDRLCRMKVVCQNCFSLGSSRSAVHAVEPVSDSLANKTVEPNRRAWGIWRYRIGGMFTKND